MAGREPRPPIVAHVITQLTVFGAIAAATLAWALSQLAGTRHERGSRLFWSLGAVLMLVHAVAAFEIFYLRSHSVALAETAHQTVVVTGIDFAGGLYLNYLFVAVWVADAVWWWTAPRSHRDRSRRVTHLIRAFFLFMFLNGAVLFADGWIRWLGIASVTAVIVAWYREASTSR